MFRSREHADEPPEHELKAPLRVLRRELRDRRLFTNDESQFSDEVDHESSVRTEHLQKRVVPRAELDITPPEQRPDNALKSLAERRIGDVALVLIELARGEESSQQQRLGAVMK